MFGQNKKCRGDCSRQFRNVILQAKEKQGEMRWLRDEEREWL